jgi:hypothetical protein
MPQLRTLTLGQRQAEMRKRVAAAKCVLKYTKGPDTTRRKEQPERVRRMMEIAERIRVA